MQHVNHTNPYPWEYANHDAVSLTNEFLDSLDRYIKMNSRRIKSFVLIKQGKIAFEEYYNGGTSNDINYIMSISKSVNALALGIAIEQGYIHSVDDEINTYLPQFAMPGQTDRNITIKELLQMSSGLRCASQEFAFWDNNKYTCETPGPQAVQLVAAASDPLEHLCYIPVKEYDRGSFCYNTLNSLLLVEVMKAALGKRKYAEYIDTQLFQPLGITDYQWDDWCRTEGYFLSFKTKDLAKFGLLMLSKGKWNEKQLIPEQWISDSINPGVCPIYGYQWWLEPGTNVHMGLGHGGQALIIIPNEEIIIAGNCNTKERANTGDRIQDVYFKFVKATLK